MLDATIRGILIETQKKEVVLPAMQRPFVWSEDQIYRLIDSLLREFPIGATLLWQTSQVKRYRCIEENVQPKEELVFNYEDSGTVSKYLVLDGQQRLTSLYVAFYGTFDRKKLYLDLLSGNPEGRDPSETYYALAFLSDTEAAERNQNKETRACFVALHEIRGMQAFKVATIAKKKREELDLPPNSEERMAETLGRCHAILGKTLECTMIDRNEESPKPMEEVLEIFVRINSGGLVLQKSDLLMSLLDQEWNDVQPELQRLVKDINQGLPFKFTRDAILKSLLLLQDSETRFDKLVGNQKKISELAKDLPKNTPLIRDAWRRLASVLQDDAKILSERFFRNGLNSLLPFVVHLVRNPEVSNAERRKLVTAIYVTLGSGVFAGAEARMGTFTKNCIKVGEPFPLDVLCKGVFRHKGIRNLDQIFQNYIDLPLNIAHGGVALGTNPDELERDHIFPRSTLRNQGLGDEADHYANFHFLRAKDNGNKSAKPPDEWFRKPGTNTPYTDDDLKDRMLSWDLLQPGKFKELIASRSHAIKERACEMFGTKETEFNKMFEGKSA